MGRPLLLGSNLDRCSDRFSLVLGSVSGELFVSPDENEVASKSGGEKSNDGGLL